jgi:hypothetical protein
MGFISRTMVKNRYNIRILFGLLSLFFGLIIDLLNIFDKPFGFLTIFGSLPILHLLNYKILKTIMKPIIGAYPYSPHWEKIGSKVMGKGYPNNRLVTNSDYFFAIILNLIPIITAVILIVIIDK